MPKRYFHHGESVQDGLRISGAAVKDTILAGVSACHACVIACGRVVRLEDGAKRKGPEYETLVGFGPNLLLNDPALATRLGELCDRYGMDSISTQQHHRPGFPPVRDGEDHRRRYRRSGARPGATPRRSSSWST